jgi:hypothetical protein
MFKGSFGEKGSGKCLLIARSEKIVVGCNSDILNSLVGEILFDLIGGDVECFLKNRFLFTSSYFVYVSLKDLI